ncbi:hypothetical protein FBU30_007969 [Linnemannia zychae]|nr:hypothetical protein FBU30_007969 [Linnemannia zychae]
MYKSTTLLFAIVVCVLAVAGFVQAETCPKAKIVPCSATEKKKYYYLEPECVSLTLVRLCATGPGSFSDYESCKAACMS